MPPRQVLIEAKIYEVTLTGELANGVRRSLRRRRVLPDVTYGRVPGLSAPCWAGALNLSVGTLVGQSRELLAFLSSQEVQTKARVLSAPSVIATDSIPASINVGDEVPTLTSQAVTGAQQDGQLTVREQHSVPQFGCHFECHGPGESHGRRHADDQSGSQHAHRTRLPARLFRVHHSRSEPFKLR